MPKRASSRVEQKLAVFNLDEKWQLLREKMLAGEVSFEDGLRGLQMLVAETLGEVSEEVAFGRPRSVPPKPSDAPQRKTLPPVPAPDPGARPVGELPLGADAGAPAELPPPAEPEPADGDGEYYDLKFDDDDDVAPPADTRPQILAGAALAGVLRRADAVAGDAPAAGNRDPIGAWRAWMEGFYRSLGFEVRVPPPDITAEQLRRWSGEGWEVFYRPSEAEVSYPTLMTALGYPDHSTLSAGMRDRIGWEPAPDGYWFFAETWTTCPRVGKSYDEHEAELATGERLLSVEEYMIFWHVMRRLFPAVFLDPHDAPVLLRTTSDQTEVLQIRTHVQQAAVEIIVRAWARNLASPRLGSRIGRVVPSVG